MTDIVDLCFRSRRTPSDGQDTPATGRDGGTVTEFGLSDLSSAETVRIGPGGVMPQTPAPDRDWTNQELADLYRTTRLLAMAGLSVDTDRGITDEGDPWFVFLDQMGEVFVHLCRIDGIYLLDSPVQDGPVTGHRFDDLIRGFTERAGAVTAAGRPEGSKVVQLRRGGKVVLHPGAALAALVWTIYLTSDDLVLLAPADRTDTGVTAPDLPLIDPLDEPDLNAAAVPEDFRALFAEEAQAATFLNMAKTERDTVLRQSGTDGRDGALLHMALTNPISAATLGLSALAMAYGVVWTQALADDSDADAVELSAQSGVAPDEMQAKALHDDAAVNRDAVKLFIDPDAAQAHLEADIAGQVPADAAQGAVVELVQGAADILDVLFASTGFGDIPDQLRIDVAEFGEDPPQDLRRTDTDVAQKDEASTATERETGAVNGEASAASDLLAFTGLNTLVSTDLKTYSVGGADLAASFDISALGDAKKDMLLDLLFDDETQSLPAYGAPAAGSYDTTSSGRPSYAEYDDQAQRFFQYLLEQNPDIYVIVTPTEILFIDMEALSAPAQDSYARSWSYSDGAVISTIGMKADFAEFDMIV